MTDQIQCPRCEMTYQSTPEIIGQTIKCTRCGQSFVAGAPPVNPTMSYASGPYAGPAPTQSNGMAVGSLVCGILGFVIPVIPSIIAIILGIIGLNRTKDPRVGGKGLAIGGIVAGGLSLILLPCMISILLPSLNRAREQANRIKCASNMKQIGLALQLYANQNRGQFPPDLQTLVSTGAMTPEVFCCPSSMDSVAPGATPAQQAQNLNAGGHLSYVYVPGLSAQWGPGNKSASTVVLYEPMTNHGTDGTNILFEDGSVQWFPRAKAESMIAQVQAGTNPPAQ